MAAGILASDLDRTLVHPRRTLPDAYREEAIDVEIYEGRPITTCTPAVLEDLGRLAAAGAFVPVTTRSAAQLERITPIWALACEAWGICANGATLLHRGVPDPEWRALLEERRGSAASVEEARAVLLGAYGSVGSESWLLRLRDCDEVFLYGICELSAMPEGATLVAEDAMAAIGWQAILHGRKLYLLPAHVTKDACVAHLASRLGATTVVAAGDSMLDAPLLEHADVAFCPADAELVTLDRVPPNAQLTAEGHLGAAAEIASRSVELLLD